MSVDDLRMWTAVLNTPTMEFALRHAGTQLHSGWFRLLKHHLRRVRLPTLSSSEKQEALKLALKLHEEGREEAQTTLLDRLDSLISKAFGLSSNQRLTIKEFLTDCHGRSYKNNSDLKIARSTKDSERANEDQFEPIKLERFNSLHRDRSDLQRHVTFKDTKKLPIHSWYPYTQGFSPNLVKTLIEEWGLSNKKLVLDPFAGGGTTSVVCKALGMPSVAVDVSPLMTWVAHVKTANYRISSLKQTISAFDYKASTRARSTHTRAPELFSEYFAEAYSDSLS